MDTPSATIWCRTRGKVASGVMEMSERPGLRIAQCRNATFKTFLYMVALGVGACLFFRWVAASDHELSAVSRVGCVVLPLMTIGFLARYSAVVLPGLVGRGGMWIDNDILYFGSPLFFRSPMDNVRSVELVELRSFGRDRPYLRLTLPKGSKVLPVFLLGDAKAAYLALRGEIRARQSAAGRR